MWRHQTWKKLPINYIYVSTNEIGMAQVTSKCLWRKTAAKIRFFQLFKVTVTLKTMFFKSRVFCQKVFALTKNLKKCLGSEEGKKHFFFCECTLLSILFWFIKSLDIPTIGWVKLRSSQRIWESVKEDSVKHFLRSSFHFDYITWVLLCKLCFIFL